MKKILLLFSSFMLLTGLVSAQKIIVVDKITRQPIIGVTVFSKDLKDVVLTSFKGEVDASLFKSTDSIYFSCVGYQTTAYTYKEIESMKFTVELSEKKISLDEFIVSANRLEQNKIEVPNRIEKINMKEVAFQNPQTTADLLATSGYAYIQKSQLAGGSPMLRGFATNRVLMVVDGVRMNTAIFRAGNLQNIISLDANALESTEILFGPGAVMYGSDAIGGVMDFHTLEPKFSDSTIKNLFTSGNVLIRNSTANSERTGHIDLNIGLKKLAFVTSFTRADYSDLREGSVGGVNYFYRSSYVQTIDNKDYMFQNDDSTLQIGSKYSQTNFMQKVCFKPTKSWEFNYGFHISETSKYDRYDRLYIMQTSGPYKDKLRWAEWYYGPQKWNIQRFGITHSKSTIAYDQLRIVGAIQNFEESRYDREFMVKELRMQKETVKALSFNLDLDKKLGEKATLYYGAELVHNTVGSYASLTHVITKEVDSTVTRYPDGSTWEADGVYVNLKYKLTEKLIVNGGARFSYCKIKADFDTTFFSFPFTHTEMNNHALNGSLGFVYAADESWQLYINGATGYRAPNIDDMGKVFESVPGYLVVPNPDLKPEHVYNAEIGTVKTFGSFLKIDFAGYYTILNDGMVRKDYMFNGQSTINYLGNKSIIQAMQNVTKINVYGIQAGIDIFYKGIGLKSTLSYQNGKEQSADSLIYYPLRHAAPMFGSTHLSYSHKNFKLDFYAIYNAEMDYEDLSLDQRINTSFAKDENGLPYCAGWYTLNFKAAYYVTQYIVLTAGIENITDLLYRPYSSGICAPGRNIITSLKARF
jgi:hemoglobin/transferrin/lactoferrin receptor protein